MSDIRKIRETLEKDGDWDEWPGPDLTVESIVSGELRARILHELGYVDDGQAVHLIETKVEGGYSEFTQEDECEIEIMIGGETAWKDDLNYSMEAAMSQFLAKFGGPND